MTPRMADVGEQLYYQSHDGERFGLARVTGYGFFTPTYRIDHEGEDRFVDADELSWVTTTGALR